MTNKDAIQLVINTLQSIQVAGADNLDKMLSCIRLLETVVNPPQDKEVKDG